MTRHPVAVIAAWVSSVLAAYACDAASPPAQSDTLPVSAFQVHECGNERFGPLFTGRRAEEYDGLRCIAWQLGEGSALIDLINFPSGCGFQGFEQETLWRGSANQPNPDLLQLTVEWDFEAPNGCGECDHDFSFELFGLLDATSVGVEVATRSCTQGCDRQQHSAVLPLGDSSQGILCKYAPPLEPDVGQENVDYGALHMLTDQGTCMGGLIPIDIPGDRQVCAPVCASDADCPLDGLLSCEDEVCRIAKPWED